MTKSTRLLQLLHTLRHRKHPATATALAAELNISPRTLYRDINTLREQGQTYAAKQASATSFTATTANCHRSCSAKAS